MFVTEEELAIEVAQIDCVQINDMDLSESRKH
jgi:hypothetical protein